MSHFDYQLRLQPVVCGLQNMCEIRAAYSSYGQKQSLATSQRLAALYITF